MSNFGTKESTKKVEKNNANPFAFLSEDVATTTYSVVTDLPEGKHTVVLKEIIEGKSKNLNPKLDFIFNNVKGGVGVDTLSFGNYGDCEKAFNRIAYLMKSGQVEPKEVTEARQALASILSENAGLTYEISSQIDTSEEIDEQLLEGLTEQDSAQAIKDHTKTLWRAYRADINEQKAEARANGFQIYDRKDLKRTFAVSINVDNLHGLITPMKDMFSSIIGKKTVMELAEKEVNYNGRVQKFMNVARYHSTFSK